MKGFFKVVICFVLVMALGAVILDVSKPKVNEGLTGTPSPVYSYTKATLDRQADSLYSRGWHSASDFLSAYRDGEVCVNLADLTVYEKRNLRDYWRTKALVFLYHSDSVFYNNRQVERKHTSHIPVICDLKACVNEVGSSPQLRQTDMRRNFDSIHALHDAIYDFIEGSWTPRARSAYDINFASGTPSITYTLGHVDFSSIRQSKLARRAALRSALERCRMLRNVGWMQTTMEDGQFVPGKLAGAANAYYAAERQRLVSFLNVASRNQRIRHLEEGQIRALQSDLQRLRQDAGRQTWGNGADLSRAFGNLESYLQQCRSDARAAASRNATPY